MVAELGEYAENHWIVYFRWIVWYMNKYQQILNETLIK